MRSYPHKTKRILCIMLSLLMLLPLGMSFSLPAKAASVWDGTWDGSGFSNNHITSAKGLAQFINNAGTGTSYAGQTIYLDVDIDLRSIDFGNIDGGKNVYYSRDNYFQGTFDGQNHTIYNFQMHNSDHRIGLFRSAKNATFKNVNFENVFIDDNNNNGKNGFAVVVGFSDTGTLTFENVHVKSGTIYGANYVGALAGEVGGNSSGNYVRITNCSNGANIIADSVRVGGLVGSSLPKVEATNCKNTGSVTAGSTDVGGIVGWIEDDESFFTGCTNEGNVQGRDAVGGIMGYFGKDSQDQKMTLDGNVNHGNITATNGRAGGIAGHLETDNNAHQIKNNVNYGAISGTDDVGGIMGRNKGFGVWDNNKNYGAVTATSGDNAGGIVGEIEDDKQIFTNCANVGEIHGKNSIGGIVGWLNNAAEDEFTRCFNTGKVTSDSGYAGGIAGRGNKLITCTECFNIGDIQGNNDSGGIAGSIDYHTFFYRCFNAGSVTAPSGKSAGGMIGYTSYNGSNSSSQQVVDCYNWGSISAGTVGGLVGWVNGGNSAYHVANSYNTGSLSGDTKWQFVGNGGACDGNCYKIENSGSGTYKTSDEFETFDFTISSNFCKNTWGVRIGSTTYKYPILTWYRDLFSFESRFVDSATGTNETILKKYGESFTVPNPTRSGYAAGQWLSGNTHRLVRGATVTAGSTYLMNTNYDKNAGPADTNTVVQSFSEPTEIKSTRTYGLTWKEGAAANMYATTWANEENNTNSRYRAGVDYTIYNVTAGHDVSYTDGSATDYTSGNSQYFKSYQKNGTGAATATLEVDRSKMDDIKDTGVYIDYYPFIYTGPGGVRWGVEIFDPNNADSKGVLNNDHWQADVTGTSGKTYHFEQRFGDVNGNDHRCAETNSDFTSEPGGTAAAERRYGGYKWYLKGAAPDAGDSVTLRVTAICAARYNSGNLQVLSEWTDLTIVGTCSHSNGHMQGTAAVTPTCTTAGNSAYWYCDACGKYFSDAAGNTEIAENSWILPATGHEWSAPAYVWADDNSTVTATRTCSHANHPETETVNTTYTVITAPGCTTPGSGRYVSNSFANAAFAVQSKIVSVNFTGHAWNAPTYVWADDHSTVTATRTCANADHPETETVQVTSSITKDPTCDDKGETTYTATFTNIAFATQTKVLADVEALGHDYGEPTFVWAEDNSSVTATRVCRNDPDHVETETVNTTSEETKEPTCEDKGETTYTAAFTNAAFGTKTKTVANIDALGHIWNAPTYVWADDNTSVTATRTCNNADHPETETVQVTSEVTKDPTCDDMGETTYTAAFENTAFATQTKTLTDVDALGHEYNEPTYTWAEDFSSVTATRVCKHDPAHVETETAAAAGEETKLPTCVEKGETTYTAAFTNTAFAPQTKVVANVNALGHAWSAPTYVWAEDNSTVTATRTCGNADHPETETVQVTSEVTKDPTCDDKGETTYTAVFTNEAFATQTKVLSDVEARGHDYRFNSFVWAENGETAQAKYVCANDPAHEEYHDATVTGEAHAATCTANAYTVFTASYDGKADTKSVTQPGTAHHTPVYIPERSATATEDGVKAHYECAVCGKLFRDEACTREVTDADLVIPATGEAPIDTAAGICPMCGEYHNTSMFGRVKGLVHYILYIIITMFGK